MSAPKRRPIERLIRVLPWIVSAAVVAFLLRRYSVEQIGAEMVKGDALWMIPAAIAVVLISIVFLGVGDWLLLRPSVPRPPSLWEVVRARCGMAILLVLGYVFVGGGYGVWIARKTGASVRATSGLVVYVMLSDLAAISTIAAVAVWLDGGALLGERAWMVKVFAPVFAVGISLHTLFAPRIISRFIRDPQLLSAWVKIPIKTYLLNLLCRIGHLSNVVLCVYWAARSFGLDIPLAAFGVYMPVVMLVGALPVNVFGFGAVQMAWLIFVPWAPAEKILAFQFLWHLLTTVTLIWRGLPFIRGVITEIAKPKVRESARSESVAVDPAAAATESTTK